MGFENPEYFSDNKMLECKLTDPCSDGSATKDEWSMPMCTLTILYRLAIQSI